MRLTLLLSLLVASTVSTGPYRQALSLYENGLYERARTEFEALAPDPLSEGYTVLCALKMRSEDYPELLSSYNKKYPSSTLSPAIHYEYALRLFDQEKYADSYAQLSMVEVEDLPVASRPEYVFKKGYCHYMEGRFPEALEEFAKLDRNYSADYSAPAWYLSGVMTYNARNFETAEEFFKKSVKDPRFADISNFYIVDCEFNQKHYDYVISEGEKIFDSVPKERREHLARIISESYLVEGEKQKAREYFDAYSQKDMTRSDYFYAGSVMYGVEDYAGAIENFSKMTNRTDSLGQIANYQMGNSQVRLRNKVAAMEAFRDASKVEFDPVITEDAFFNYAKLAFDLNKDTSGFAEYIKRWYTKAKGEQIYSYMALAALYDRDYAGAVEAYDNIDELDTDMRQNYAKANYLRAAQLVEGGSYRDAVPFLRASSYYIPKAEKFNQLARYWMAESYYRTGNWAEARKTFTELYNGSALMDMPEGKVLPYNVAYCFLNEEDYSQAAKWFDMAASSSGPEYVEDALVRRADCDFAAKDYKAAIKSYGNVIDRFGTEENIYSVYRQALAYGLSGDRKKKVAALKTVENLPAGAAFRDEALYELGRTQMEQKSNTDAVATFTKLRNTSGNPAFVAKALIGMGMVNRNASNYDKALENYKEVVSTMPGTEYAEDALLAIESIYQTRKQPEKYLEYVEQNSIATGESDKEAMYFSTAEKIYLAGNWTQAVTSIKKYQEMYPNGAGKDQLAFYLAESYNALGEKEKACDAYASVLEGNPGASIAEVSRLNYSRISYELERYKDAYRGYTALLGIAQMEGNRQAASEGMMRSAYKGKDYESAISAANNVIRSSATTKEVQREAKYILAKSSLATSRRDAALALFKELSESPSTPEGAEARYILLQDSFDRGNFEAVENLVYEFSKNVGDQYYWLAKAYILLGDSFLERGKKDQAKATYESVRDGYAPQNGVADDITESVRTKLERLDKLSK